jgi:FtsH-binding integral membrane protein
MSWKSRLRDYVAGSLVANSPAWLLSLMIPYLRAEKGEIFTALILFFTVMAGGVLSGYMVARRVQSEYVKTGLSTGFFSYALYAVFLTLTGFRGGTLEDVISITGFVVGGAVGARLWERQINDRRT